MKELPVTSNLTQEQIHQWAANLPASAEVKTKTDGEGRTVLYARNHNRAWQLFHKTGQQARVRTAQDFVAKALRRRDGATEYAAIPPREETSAYAPVRNNSPYGTPIVVPTSPYGVPVPVNESPPQPASAQQGAHRTFDVKTKHDQPLIAQAAVDALPKSLRESREFHAAVVNLGKALKGNHDAALTQATNQLAKLISSSLEKEPSSVQMRFALTDTNKFLNSLLPYVEAQTRRTDIHSPLNLLQSIPKSMDAMPSGKAEKLQIMFDQIASNLSDRSLPNDGILINHTKYERMEALGGGRFGTVYRYVATERPLPKGVPEELAVKVPKYDSVSGGFRANAIDGPLHEARVMVNATGTGAATYEESLLKFEGLVRNFDGAVLVATRMEKGSTAKSLVNEAKSKLDASEITSQEYQTIALTLLKDAMQGGARLQKGVGVVHFDLKPDNWLISADGRVRLADPGIARSFAEDGTPGTQTVEHAEMVPVGWTSPEALATGRATSASDVWTMGLAIYEFMTGRGMMSPNSDHPVLGWEGQGVTLRRPIVSSPMELVPKLAEFAQDPNNRLIQPQDITQYPMLAPYADLINRMTHPDPNQRPTFEEVLKDPIFQQAALGSPETRELIKTVIPAPQRQTDDEDDQVDPYNTVGDYNNVSNATDTQQADSTNELGSEDGSRRDGMDTRPRRRTV